MVVNCLLANTVVTVRYSQEVLDGFSDYETTVASSLDSLVYVRNENRKGYFQPLPLDIRARLSYVKPDGSEQTQTLFGRIPFPLANRHYEVLVDASISEGLAAFQIFMDTTELPLEIIEVSDGSGTSGEGAYAYEDLLITEVMCNPDALPDSDGEWFEVYNASDEAIQMQNLILGRDETNRHTITEDIQLQPGEFLVLERGDSATLAPVSYAYGGDILLPNSGATLSIFNEGTESEPGSLIFSLDYGLAAFPTGTGASIALDPGISNPGDVVLGASWCISSTAYYTGDLGTPGTPNDACQ